MTRSRPHARTGYRLSQLGSLTAQRFADSVKVLGLTASEAGVLRLLARHEGINQRDLATRLGSAPSRVVALLDSLEDQGQIQRRRSPTDRRQHEVLLTDAGRTTMRQLRAVAEANEMDLVGPLTLAERTQLVVLLDKLASAHGLDPEVHPGFATPGADR
jgi:DNA-binding MarR family transcriptional regulator